MKKFLATFLTVAMVFCFMPSISYGVEASGNNILDFTGADVSNLKSSAIITLNLDGEAVKYKVSNNSGNVKVELYNSSVDTEKHIQDKITENLQNTSPTENEKLPIGATFQVKNWGGRIDRAYEANSGKSLLSCTATMKSSATDGEIKIYLPKDSVKEINGVKKKFLKNLNINITGLNAEEVTGSKVMAIETGTQAKNFLLKAISGREDIVVSLEFSNTVIPTEPVKPGETVEPESPTEPSIIKIISGVKNTELNASSKVGRGYVTISWTKSRGYKVDGYEVFRSTKKNIGYGSKPIFKTVKNTYKNTKKLKKGTRYYYKVRGYRFVEGKKIYTQWSDKTSRIAK